MPNEIDTVYRLPEVLRSAGVGKSTLYDWLNPTSPRFDPTFPRPIRLGSRAVGWRRLEVATWIETRERVGQGDVR